MYTAANCSLNTIFYGTTSDAALNESYCLCMCQKRGCQTSPLLMTPFSTCTGCYRRLWMPRPGCCICRVTQLPLAFALMRPKPQWTISLFQIMSFFQDIVWPFAHHHHHCYDHLSASTFLLFDMYVRPQEEMHFILTSLDLWCVRLFFSFGLCIFHVPCLGKLNSLMESLACLSSSVANIN